MLINDNELQCCARECPYYLDCKRGTIISKETFDYSYKCNKESGFQDFVLNIPKDKIANPLQRYC